MNTIVLKYGGSSVADIDKINSVADRIIEKKNIYKNVVTVVSAMGKSTDTLLDMANQLSENPIKRELDVLLSTGEQTTISLLTIAINAKGYKAISLTGQQAGFLTWGPHTKNRIEDVDTTRVEKYLKEGYIVIVAGFQGVNEIGDITTLGRGGSDTSAVALAAKLKCPCEIYTDVEGIFTVDPRIHKEAKKLDNLSYEETMEMAYLGAGIIEPRSVEMAWKYGVKLYIGLNTGKVLGTYITEEGDKLEKNVINNISIIDDILLVNIYLDNNSRYTTSEIFADLANNNVNVDVISQNIIKNDKKSVSFTTTLDNKTVIKEIFKDNDIEYNFIDNVIKLSIIGNAMRNQPGVASQVFSTFIDNNIDFYQVSTSEISISYIIDSKYKNKVVKILAKEFNL
ncbi:MAG: aspartate kinase [Tissierellia bacterium]|nr:aspartate kinase [Tissierellia bacterium]